MLTIIIVLTATKTVNPDSSHSTTDTTTTQYILKTLSTSSPSSTEITFNTEDSSISSSSTSKTSSASSTSSAYASPVPISLGVEPSLSSSKLGLAIGIPMAVLSVCILAVLVWSFAHKKLAKKSTDVLHFNDFTREGAVDLGPNWKTGEGVVLEKALPERIELEPILEKVPPRKSIFNRLSKMINMSEWPASPREFKSPLFLRRFHLNAQDKEKTVGMSMPNISDEVSTKLDLTLGSGAPEYLGHLFVVVKPYARRLGDELTICTGEKATLKKTHSDGWATVEVGGSEGVVPMMCLKRVL